MLAAVPVLLLLLLFRSLVHVWGFIQLFEAGSAAVALAGVTGIFFVYRNDPYIDPRSLLAGLVARGES